MDKLSKLRSLVSLRREPQSGTVAAGYTKNFKKLADFHSGVYDFDDHVVPYSKTAYNLDADILILGQDWASEEFLSKSVNQDQVKYGFDPKLPTNTRLFGLLEDYWETQFQDTYATDLFVFVKGGDMTAGLKQKDLVLSATQFAIPQIEIIEPKIVICLGGATFNAVRKCNGLGYTPLKHGLSETSFRLGNSMIVGVNHKGGVGTAVSGGQAAHQR